MHTQGSTSRWLHGAPGQVQVCFEYLHLHHQQSDRTCYSQSPLGLEGELWDAIGLISWDRFEPEVKRPHIPFHIRYTMQLNFNLSKKFHFKDNLIYLPEGFFGRF